MSGYSDSEEGRSGGPVGARAATNGRRLFCRFSRETAAMARARPKGKLKNTLALGARARLAPDSSGIEL